MTKVETIARLVATARFARKFLVLALSLPLSALAAQVIKIIDGDTLTVLEKQREVKIRLANIDAPEKAQPFGQRSKQFLSDLCFRKKISYRVQEIDWRGRAVAVVTCAGIEVNRAQVERGMAWVYPEYNHQLVAGYFSR